MPLYLTVQQFQIEHTRHLKPIHVKTVYRWIDEGNPNLKVRKDFGGRGWLIIIEEDNPLFPFLVKQPAHVVRKER